VTRGSGPIWQSLLCLAVVAMVAWGCASTAPPAAPPSTPVVTGPPPPEVFESPDFIVVIPKTPETSASLAAKYLGDAAKAWMIEEFTGAGTFAPGQQAVIPRKAWNPAGVTASGYRLVPILVYHNLDAQPKGKLVQSAASFDAQMRYLKTEGYHTLTLAEFLDFTRLNRQLPRKSVVLTFDDGYKSFKQYAYPVLKELGFTATLFVYTDYVGAGRNALSWRTSRRSRPRASISRRTRRPTATSDAPRARAPPSSISACMPNSPSLGSSSSGSSAKPLTPSPIPTAAGTTTS